MKKVLFVIDTIDVGGATKLTFDVITNLDKNIFDYRIFYLNNPKFKESNLLDYYNLSDKSTYLGDGIFRFFKRLYYIYKYSKEYRTVHSCMEQSNLYCTFIKVFFNRKMNLIITYHGLDRYFIEKRIKFSITNIINKFLYTTFQNWLFKKTDKFIAVCFAIKEYLISKRSINGNNIEVVYHGLDLNYASELLKFSDKTKMVKDNYVIGYAGRLASQKGLEKLVEILPKLISKNPEVILVLKGDGELKSTLIKRIHELDIQDYVIFEKFEKNVYSFYKKLNLFILPSSFETTNLTVLESMYCKTLVLCTDVGGLPEIVENNYNGFLFSSYNFDEILKRIEYIKSLDTGILESIKENAFQTVINRFNLKSNVKNIQKILSE